MARLHRGPQLRRRGVMENIAKRGASQRIFDQAAVGDRGTQVRISDDGHTRSDEQKHHLLPAGLREES